MNFTIDPIPFWTSGVATTAIVFVVIILVSFALLILSITLDWDLDELFLALSVSSTVVGLIAVPFAGSYSVTTQLRTELTSGISGLGFKNVKLDSDGEGFTASQEGKYVQGVIRETEDNKYEVLLLEAVK